MDKYFTGCECTPFVKPLELCRTSCLTLMAQTTLLAKFCFFWIKFKLCGNFIWTRWAQIKIWTQTRRYTLFPVISVLLRWRKLSLARVLKWKYGIEGRVGHVWRVSPILTIVMKLWETWVFQPLHLQSQVTLDCDGMHQDSGGLAAH